MLPPEPTPDTLHRVSIREDMNTVDVLTLGMCVDDPMDGVYTLEQLPVWMQEKISVLAICDPTPPNESIKGVGKRVNESTYWIYEG